MTPVSLVFILYLVPPDASPRPYSLQLSLTFYPLSNLEARWADAHSYFFVVLMPPDDSWEILCFMFYWQTFCHPDSVISQTAERRPSKVRQWLGHRPGMKKRTFPPLLSCFHRSQKFINVASVFDRSSVVSWSALVSTCSNTSDIYNKLVERPACDVVWSTQFWELVALFGS